MGISGGDELKSLTHKLGGNPDDYVVNMHFQHWNIGINQNYYGGNTSYDHFGNPERGGAYWFGLYWDGIILRRAENDYDVTEARVRIWKTGQLPTKICYLPLVIKK